MSHNLEVYTLKSTEIFIDEVCFVEILESTLIVRGSSLIDTH